VRRAHPPFHISLDGLAVSAHWSCPQAPGYTNERGDIFPEPGGNHAPQQLPSGLALHQQAADELGGDLLVGAGEDGVGEVLGECGGFGCGYA